MSMREIIWKLRDHLESLLTSLGLSLPGKVMYIGGSDTLPAPLEREAEAELIARLERGAFQPGTTAKPQPFAALETNHRPPPTFLHLGDDIVHAFPSFPSSRQIRISSRFTCARCPMRCSLHPLSSSTKPLPCPSKNTPFTAP